MKQLKKKEKNKKPLSRKKKRLIMIIAAGSLLVLAAGYTPAVYSSTNWSILDLNLEDLQSYDLWYAYYGVPEDLYFPYEYTMWQYTDKGRVDGIETSVDINISFMDYSTR